MDDTTRGAGPLKERGNVATERGIVHLVKHDSEESHGLVGWVCLELGVDLDDEGESNDGEQTSLGPKSAYMHRSNEYNLRTSTSCSDPRYTSS